MPTELGSLSKKYHTSCVMIKYVNGVSSVELAGRKMEEALDNLNPRIDKTEKQYS